MLENIINIVISALQLAKDKIYFNKTEFDLAVEKIIVNLPAEKEAIKRFAKLLQKSENTSWHRNQLYDLISPISMYSLIGILWEFSKFELIKPYFIIEISNKKYPKEYSSIRDISNFIYDDELNQEIRVEIENIKVYYRRAIS